MREGDQLVRPATMMTVAEMVADRLPQYRHLPLTPVRLGGTENLVCRLGDNLLVRVPRTERAAAEVGKAQTWLPILASQLPLDIPRLEDVCRSGGTIPFDWSLYRWIPGSVAIGRVVRSSERSASTLAAFLRALHGITVDDGRRPAPVSTDRGVPLWQRDAETSRALSSLEGLIDVGAARELWRRVGDLPGPEHFRTLIHGDLHPGNLLCRRGRLTAVIDFGSLTLGDPAADLMAAWTFLSGRSRRLFRQEVGADDVTWARAGGWALSVGIIGLNANLRNNPSLAAICLRTINEVLRDLS